MNSRIDWVAFLVSLLVGIGGSTPGPADAETVIACDTAQLAEVEFLEGTWTVEVIEPDDPTGVRRGVSTVSPILGGCALQETLRLEDRYEEVRIVGFDGRGATWQLAIVDSGHGNLLLLTGHQVEGGLEFITMHQRSTSLLVDRVSITRTEGGWVYRVESAPGYGEDWRLLQEIRYTQR